MTTLEDVEPDSAAGIADHGAESLDVLDLDARFVQGPPDHSEAMPPDEATDGVEGQIRRANALGAWD